MKGSKLIFTLFFIAGNVFAQGQKCFSDQATEKLMQKYPQYALELQEEHQARLSGKYNHASNQRATIHAISVVVHVVYGTTQQNVSDANIISQINTLNKDFRRFNSDAAGTRSVFLPVATDVQIEFCLASLDPSGNSTNGITRTASKTQWDYDNEADDMKFTSSGGIDAWDTRKYLNVWIVNLFSSSGTASGVAGYAYRGASWVHGSSIDGIVLDYQTGFGATDRSLTHEAGHYLGLKHVWGDGVSPNWNSNCTNDDGFSDTPKAAGPNYNGCNSNPSSCNSQDQFENYMDYSSCSNMFTIQQGSAMRSLLNGTRSSLLTSQACNSAPFANFRTVNQTVCAGGSITFEDISIYQPTSWQWSFPGGTPSQSSVKNPTVTYAASGNYAVTLIATNAGGSNTDTKSAFAKITASPALSVSGTNTVCDLNNGAVSLTVSTGSVPFTFSWSNGATVQNLAGVPSGTYSVTVADRFNCTATSSATVLEENDLQIFSITEPDSSGTGKGIASIALTGGTPPYSYEWNDLSNSTTTAINGLVAGSYTVTATDMVGCRIVKTLSIGDINPVTGINLMESMKMFEIYPNPASDVLNVRFSLEQPATLVVEIYNAAGKSMLQKNISVAREADLQLDVRNFPKGVCYLKLTTSQGSVVKKVVLVK